MTTIIDGSASADFATPLPVAEGGTGNTNGSTLTSKISSFTYDMSTATGTIAYTGVGFEPVEVIFFAGTDDGSAVGRASTGVDNGTGKMTLADRSQVTARTWRVSTSESIRCWTGASDSVAGYISTMGSDGFTISWTKTGSPTGTLTVTYAARR
jgi:hypothetical protein